MKPRPPLPPGPYLVLGLARSGVAAAGALRARGETVFGVDMRTPSAGTTRALSDAGVRLRLDPDDLGALEGVRTVVKSPGVPARAPLVATARARGLTVIGELELGWRLLANEFIAVTGTNGKTTTVEMIGHIHRTAGLAVEVAGNVGTALSGLVGNVERDTRIVCEVSSFQLEDTLAFAPEAAVLLNVTPDHLDRHGTMAAYTAAKLEVFARQEEGDVAVLPAGFEGTSLEAPGGQGGRVYFGAAPEAALCVREGSLWWLGMPLLAIEELRLPGAHNVQNAMAAAAVCLARGVDRDAVRVGLRTFAGVPHRLEELARTDGVLYVNDSKATNVASTLVALAAFPDVGIHLILGGQGKGQDFSALAAEVGGRCRAVYLIGEDAPLIAAALADAGVPLRDCGELETAIARARDATATGEVVLLSPGCASFDQFTDFEARGERFRELVGG